jgi:hypothetical protein
LTFPFPSHLLLRFPSSIRSFYIGTMTQLTNNAIRQIYDDVSNEPSLIDPIVQVINIKKLPAGSPDNPDRYR